MVHSDECLEFDEPGVVRRCDDSINERPKEESA